MAAKIRLFSDPANRAWAASASPCVIPYKGHLLWCAEQRAKMAQSKAAGYKEKVLTAYTLKALLYVTKPFNMTEMGFKVDDAYDKVKAARIGAREKFKHNPVLAQLLVATGKARLIYDAPFDDFFGTGKNGTGENRYGLILEKIRDELVSGKLIPVAFLTDGAIETISKKVTKKALDPDKTVERIEKKRKPGRNRSPSYDENEPRRKNTGKLTKPEKSSVKKRSRK